jgi:hypothetical protein
MFYESLAHLAQLDAGWFLSLFLNNLFWVFAFIALMHFFTDGKKAILGAVLIIFDLMIFVDFEFVAGAVIFSGVFMAIYYISKLAFLTFIENSRFRKHMIIAGLLQGWVVLFLYNIFMV